MGKSSYAFQHFDKSRHVRARIKDKDISHKHSREIALAIKGMSLEKSREFLERVLSKEIAVPYRRYNNQISATVFLPVGFQGKLRRNF
jgi:large subunit ribosomal protein L22